jgi:thiosulfate dehydrogenase
MARLNTAAAFTKAIMPHGQENSLSDQDALDIAAYFVQQPRPDFREEEPRLASGRQA